MIIKEKKNCTVIIKSRSELGINSMPFVSGSATESEDIDVEIHNLMVAHGMTKQEAEDVRRENLEWASL
jgi:hypothetical protein